MFSRRTAPPSSTSVSVEAVGGATVTADSRNYNLLVLILKLSGGQTVGGQRLDFMNQVYCMVGGCVEQVLPKPWLAAKSGSSENL